MKFVYDSEKTFWEIKKRAVITINTACDKLCLSLISVERVEVPVEEMAAPSTTPPILPSHIPQMQIFNENNQLTTEVHMTHSIFKLLLNSQVVFSEISMRTAF